MKYIYVKNKYLWYKDFDINDTNVSRKGSKSTIHS